MIYESVIPVVHSFIGILYCEIVALLQISFKLFRPEVKHNFKD